MQFAAVDQATWTQHHQVNLLQELCPVGERAYKNPGFYSPGFPRVEASFVVNGYNVGEDKVE